VGFLGVAGIAIIAVYIFAQGRRVRRKERAEAKRRSEIEAAAAASKEAEPETAGRTTGADQK